MSTEERLSEIEYQKKRMELNRRFVEMYEDEVSYILEQKEDIEIMEKLSGEEAKLISEEARKYNRIFARIFYDSAGGRVSDEEFLPLWEREEEIRQGLSRIQSLEGEKKQIEKEISVQEDEERDDDTARLQVAHGHPCGQHVLNGPRLTAKFGYQPTALAGNVAQRQ